MSEDPLADLVQGIVAERSEREAKLQALADRLLGRQAPPPPPTTPLPGPAAPPPPSTPSEARAPSPIRTTSILEGEMSDWARRQMSELREQRDELQRKNMALFEELERLRAAPPPSGPDPEKGMLEKLVQDLRGSLAAAQAGLEAETKRADHLAGRLEKSGVKSVDPGQAAEIRRLEAVLQAERVQADQDRRETAQVRSGLTEALAELRAVRERQAPPPAPVADLQASRKAWLDAILQELKKA